MSDEWMDTGHLELGDLRRVYERRSSLEELLSDKLGHAIPQCHECELTMAAAMLELQGVPESQKANTKLLETLRDAGRLGADRLKQWMAEEADELLAVDLDKRLAMLDAEDERFCLPPLVDELVERCEQQLTKDAQRARELAELAVEVSLRVDPAVFHSLAYHARARAEAHLANCLRLHDEAHAARDAFHHARKLYGLAAHSEPLIEAEIQRLAASLAIDQRRFDEAQELLDEALVSYQRLGTTRRIALTLLKRAYLAYHRGNPAVGLEDLHAAVTMLDPVGDQRLYLMASFNSILYSIEAGQVEQAQRQYQEHQDLLEKQPEPWFALRVMWLRAKLAQAHDKPKEARELYVRAREGFLREALGYDAALVSLELALMYLQGNNVSAVRRLAAEMLAVFDAQDVHREALAALALFQQAARAESLTVDFVRRLRRYLQLARRDPTLKFENLDD